VDIVAMFAPVTKWNTRIERAAAIPEVVRKAFRMATQEKMGPTHLELPEDVAAEEVPEDEAQVLPIHNSRLPLPSPEVVEAALALLRRARRPVMLAGNGVIRTRAAADLASFARRLHIPVVHTFMGKGILSDTDPLSWGTVGLLARDTVMGGIDAADLILAVGYDPVEFAPANWNGNPSRPIIHIDTAPAGGDRGAAWGPWQPAGRTRRASAVPADVRERIQRHLEDYADDDGFPLKPQRILADLRAALDPRDIVVSDVGAHKLWVAKLFPTQ